MNGSPRTSSTDAQTAALVCECGHAFSTHDLGEDCLAGKCSCRRFRSNRQEFALEREQDFPCVACGTPDADWNAQIDELRCPDHQEVLNG